MKRSRMLPLLAIALAFALAACATAGPPGPAPVTRSFANDAAIAIPGDAAATEGPAAPYPSPIVVADMPTSTVKVVVTLHRLAHTYPADLDVLLVGPTGQHVLLLSDVGGGGNVVDVTLAFDAFSIETPIVGGPLEAGTYRPTNVGDGDVFPGPAPAGPYATDLTVFRDTDPNGTWNLFVVDDNVSDVGALAGGWSLEVTAR